MRDMLKVQELMDLCLDQRDEELCQLQSQSQADGAQLAALSLQVQELISLVEARAKVVGKDLEEINGQFDCHRGEINQLKIREKDTKEETEKLKGFIVGAGHEAQSSRIVWTEWRRTSAGAEELLLRLGKSSSLLGTRVGQSCPMLLLLERSMWLLLSKILFPSLSQLRFLHAALAPLLPFLPWKILLKKLLSSVMIWMGF